MGRKNYSTDKIINKLREVEILLQTGVTLSQAIKKIEVSDVTYYRWRKEYGGLKVDQAKRLKELENENQRLKKIVADLSLDNAVLREVASPKY